MQNHFHTTTKRQINKHTNRQMWSKETTTNFQVTAIMQTWHQWQTMVFSLQHTTQAIPAAQVVNNFKTTTMVIKISNTAAQVINSLRHTTQVVNRFKTTTMAIKITNNSTPVTMADITRARRKVTTDNFGSALIWCSTCLMEVVEAATITSTRRTGVNSCMPVAARINISKRQMHHSTSRLETMASPTLFSTGSPIRCTTFSATTTGTATSAACQSQ